MKRFKHSWIGVFAVLVMASSCTVTATKTYKVSASLDNDTRAYLVASEPNVWLDTLTYDDDEAHFLGEGEFQTKFLSRGTLKYGGYSIVLEKPGCYPKVYKAYELARGSVVYLEKPSFVERDPLQCPVDIDINDVEIGYASSWSTNNMATGRLVPGYHTGYSYGEDYVSEEEQEKAILGFITQTLLIAKSENNNDSIQIPALRLNMEIEFFTKSQYGYYSYYQEPLVKVELVLKNKAGEEIATVTKEHKLMEESFLIALTEDVEELIKEVPFDDVVNDYIRNLQVEKDEWAQKDIQRSKNSSAQMHDGVVTITTKGGHGSGVIISDDLILTNHHVVGDEEEVAVRTPNGTTYRALLIRTDPYYDIALIRVVKGGLQDMAVPVSTADSIKVGEIAYCVGSPLDVRLDGSVSRGMITGLFTKGAKRHYVVSASVNGGNSGGALLNEQGELIGIVKAKMTGNRVKNIGFAIPVADIEKSLNLKFLSTHE